MKKCYLKPVFLLAFCFMASMMLKAQANYVLSMQLGSDAGDVTGTYSTTGTNVVNGSTFVVYQGPTESGHVNQNAFRIEVQANTIPVPFPPFSLTVLGWRLVDATTGDEIFALSGTTINGSSDPEAPAGTWTCTAAGCGDFVSGAALPVEWSFIRAEAGTEAAKLEWGTATESANKGFEVQHSANGKDWDVLDFVVGVGNASEENHYEYAHQRPVSGDNFYRLRQVDFDGVFEFSDIVYLEWEMKENTPLVYPNPTAGPLTINFPSPLIEGSVQLVNLQGQVVERYQIANESLRMELMLSNTLPAGNYYLMTTAGQESYRIPIQKL